MKKYTPDLSSLDEKKEYIEEHLFDELRYLLPAATEWSIQHQLKLEIPGYEVQVYAMDSTALRARTLFEFFLNRTTGNYYGADQFVKTNLKSDAYTNNWKGPLHSHLMHAQDRSNSRQLNTHDGPKNLNEMPVYFAKEILRLWEEFEESLGKSGKNEDQELQKLARDKRKEAIEAAENVVRSPVAQHHAKCKGETLKPVFVFK